MKILKFTISLFLAVFLLVSVSSPVFAKGENEGEVSIKQCKKAVENINKLLRKEYKQKEKEGGKNEMKAQLQHWEESKDFHVEQCQKRATPEGVKCVMAAKNIDQMDQCPN